MWTVRSRAAGRMAMRPYKGWAGVADAIAESSPPSHDTRVFVLNRASYPRQQIWSRSRKLFCRGASLCAPAGSRRPTRLCIRIFHSGLDAASGGPFSERPVAVETVASSRWRPQRHEAALQDAWQCAPTRAWTGLGCGPQARLRAEARSRGRSRTAPTSACPKEAPVRSRLVRCPGPCAGAGSGLRPWRRG
jgi:hypothetical protein